MPTSSRQTRAPSLAARLWVVAGSALLLGALLPMGGSLPAIASHTPVPSSVTIAGSLQSELGCPGDWQPDCAATHLTLDADDAVWQDTFDVPAGDWAYKAPLNDSWDENYGLHATAGGADIPLSLGAPRRSSSTTTTRRTGSPTTSARSSRWLPAASRASSAAPATGTRAACARGSRTSTAMGRTSSRRRRCLQALTRQGRDQRVLGRELRPGRRPGRREHRLHGAGDTPTVTFTYDASTHVLDRRAGHGHDDNVEWDGLRHDSRDRLYRTPGGAVPAGTPVTLRFRTFHDDVTSVTRAPLRASMPAAALMRCRSPPSDVVMLRGGPRRRALRLLERRRSRTRPRTTSGTDSSSPTAATPTTTPTTRPRSTAASARPATTRSTRAGRSWSTSPASPRRLGGGRGDLPDLPRPIPERPTRTTTRRPATIRYDDPVLRPAWGVKPEGYCRNYEDGATNCPWRFDRTPPADSPTKEQPRGRDYFGGDLKGVDQQLDYLAALGVNAIYFNPIFDAGSNHSYDTQDYREVDPAFGTQKDLENLVKHADTLGIRIILDGVFNHMSSRQPVLRSLPPLPDGRGVRVDDARRIATGSCSPRSAGNACAGADGPTPMTYEGWFGFDSIPVLRKSRGRGPGLLPDRAGQHREALAGSAAPRAGAWTSRVTHRSRTATGRRSATSSSRGPRGPDDQRDVAEGLDAAADDPRRPARHDDELPAPRRGHRPARAAAPSTRRASPTAAAAQRVGVRRRGCVDPRGLPGRRLLRGDEPARQPRHRADPVDAHARS